MTTRHRQRFSAPAVLAVSLCVVASCSSDLSVKPLQLAIVHATIRDPDGVGIAGVQIFLDRSGDNLSVGYSKTTDSTGACLFRIPEGPYVAQIWVAGSRVPDVRNYASLKAVAPRTEFDFRYGGVRVDGRLIGPGGPINDGSVRVLGATNLTFLISAESPLSGQRYRLFIPAGGYWFTATPSPRYRGLPTVRTDPVTITADTTIDLAVSGNPVDGTITLGAASLGGAIVYARNGDVSVRDTTGADGTYLIYLPTGSYGFTGYPGEANRFIVPKTLGPISISGAQTIPLDLSGTQWSGTVRSATDSSAIGAVDVRAAQWYTYDSAVSTTDFSGQFRLIVQAGKTYDLALASASAGIAPFRITGIQAGSDSTFDLFVQRAGP